MLTLTPSPPHCCSPPHPEQSTLRLKVIWTDKQGQELVIADTQGAYRVAETG